MENGANDTNEMTRGNKMQRSFGLLYLFNIFTGILLTMRGGGRHTNIVTKQKINQMEIWFFDNRENRIL